VEPVTWWQSGVIYQIYPRSFADANGDGVGDLRGILDHLGYLNDGTDDSLGVAAIWLSPFYRSPMADFGYDISDYTDVDPVFGTLADFDDLLAGAHRRGLKLIVDWVPNHTSDQHPWFVESARSLDNAKRDWYVWRDPAPDGGPPNNWRSAFPAVGSAWTFDKTTAQYYLHSFTPHQPDLNWDNPEVEAAMHDVLRFWLDRGVDGFRIDVIYKIAKDPELRDNEPGLQHDEDWPTIHDRLRRIRAVIDKYDDRMIVGEVYLLDLKKLVEYINTGDELHLAHNFVFFHLPWQAAAYRASVQEFAELAEVSAERRLDQRFLVALNFSSRRVPVVLADDARGPAVLELSTRPEREHGPVDLTNLVLEPDEGMILRRQALAEHVIRGGAGRWAGRRQRPVRVHYVPNDRRCVPRRTDSTIWSGCLLGLPVRADQGMCLGCPHRVGQRVDVVGAAMAFAVDEERGRAGDAAQVGGVHVLGDLGFPGVAAQVGGEPPRVQAELGGVPEQVVGGQRVLVRQQLIMHRPERALAGRGLGTLGGQQRVRVHVGQRQVPPHVPQVTVAGQQLPDHRFGLAAVRALVVAVFDQRDQRLVSAAHVIALGIDRDCQVDDGLGGAKQGACPQRFGQHRGDPEDRPAEQ
jgi:Alpha amylase, catalytic domain